MEVSVGPGQNPARWWPAGGDGGVEEHEGSEGYPGVCSVGVGNGRRWGRGVSSRQRRLGQHSDGGPACGRTARMNPV